MAQETCVVCKQQTDNLVGGIHVLLNEQGEPVICCTKCKDIKVAEGWEWEATAKGFPSGASAQSATGIAVTLETLSDS